MRLDRFLATGLGLSRKDAARLLRRGRVEVDGEVERDGAVHVRPGASRVEVEGEEVSFEEEVHLVLHKPRGVVTATEDPSEPTVLGLVPERLRRRGLAPAGRLDKETTGLLVLTTDGALNHALTSPRRHLPRTYRAVVTDLDAGAAARFAEGLVLADGTRCRPASLARTGPDEVRVVVREGRYHQVRRMVAACGGRVVSLHREAIGSFALPPELGPGDCRPLESGEIELLLRDPERE